MNHTALVGLNLLHDKFRQVPVYKVRELVENNACIIDVREADEFEKGHLINAVNIPMSQFRERLSEIPTDVPVTISGNYRLGDIRHNYADITLARNLLGYIPHWSFDAGIAKFVEWVNQQHVQEDKYEDSIEEMKRKGLYT